MRRADEGTERLPKRGPSSGRKAKLDAPKRREAPKRVEAAAISRTSTVRRSTVAAPSGGLTNDTAKRDAAAAGRNSTAGDNFHQARSIGPAGQRVSRARLGRLTRALCSSEPVADLRLRNG
jgi:hypothetical protein